MEFERHEGSGPIEFVKLAEMDVGDYYEGVYIEPMYNQFDNGDISTTYKLLTEGGTVIGFPGTTVLNSIMNKIDGLSYVRIILDGLRESTKLNDDGTSRSPTKLFVVERAKEPYTEGVEAMIEQARGLQSAEWPVKPEPKPKWQPPSAQSFMGGRKV